MENRLYDLERRIAALEATLQKEIWPDTSKEDELVRRWGEYVTKTEAADILGVCRATIYFMLDDGRLTRGMGGSKVSLRSIARYMSATNKRSASDDC